MSDLTIILLKGEYLYNYEWYNYTTFEYSVNTSIHGLTIKLSKV